MEEAMNQLAAYWPFLVPLFLIQIGLMVASVWHVLKHETYRFGSRTLWLIICVVFQMIGPIVYFTVGREQE